MNLTDFKVLGVNVIYFAFLNDTLVLSSCLPLGLDHMLMKISKSGLEKDAQLNRVEIDALCCTCIYRSLKFVIVVF